ncbi:MAG: aryl-sulfate sulfotransferase [Bacteroidales bacterium]|nr:aryl-sulfate sulfotransferase [Candidatus Latescibacterota bacterium]
MNKTFVFSVLVIFALVCIAVMPTNAGAESKGWFKYQSPIPGARQVSPGTSLIFRTGTMLESKLPDGARGMEGLVDVTGSVSGVIDGRWTLARDGRTMIFKPQREFILGETVTVTLHDPTEMTKRLFSSDFKVKSRIVEYTLELDQQIGMEESEGGVVEGFQSDGTFEDPEKSGKPDKDRHWKNKDGEELVLPDNFPVIEITATDGTAPGYIFMTNNSGKNGTEGNYMMILDDTGYPEFFRETPGKAIDFKMQKCGALSYFHGLTNYFYLMDDTYTVIDSFIIEGYPMDMHDFVLSPEGHALLIGNDPDVIDMSVLVAGGDTAANVTGNVIQEFDPDGNLVFEWRTIDHFDILDTNIDLTGHNIRYAHVNAVEFDSDGNILISSRHQSEITKIDRETGEIIWRMGGPNNQFELIGDTQWFSRQHDIRRLPNGNVTLFDNGNLNDPQESRGVEYKLDEVNMVATMVWEFRNDPSIYGSSRGSTQRLSNGNTIIGYGSGRPSAIEVAYDGTKVLELELPPKNISYRVFRFPWSGKAALPTAWIVEGENRIAVWFKKFGDDNVERYYLYGGDSPNPTRKIGVSLDNSIDVRDLMPGITYYFRVTAVDRHGVESPFSNEISFTPGFMDSSMVFNADLKVTPRSLDMESCGNWITAHVSFPDTIDQEVSAIDLETVMLNGRILIDWFPKNWEWGHGKEDDGSEDGTDAGKRHLKLKFSREEFIDLFGTEAGSVPVSIRGFVGEESFVGYDTICVFQGDDSTCCYNEEDGDENGDDQDEGEDDNDGIDDGEDPDIEDPAIDDPADDLKPEILVVHQNYPNPFNPVTCIRFDLPARMRVNLSVYDIRGGLVVTLADREMDAGSRQVVWDGMNASGEPVVSGMYFYKLTTQDKIVTKKMVLLR